MLRLGERPQLTVLNKTDLLTDKQGNQTVDGAVTAVPGIALTEWPPDTLLVSAAQGWGMDELLERIEGALAAGSEKRLTARHTSRG